MKFIIISFKSRNSLLSFVKILRNFGIPADIINTPRQISRSCGLSAKAQYQFYNSILNIIKTSKIADLMGIFLVEQFGFQERIQRLY